MATVQPPDDAPPASCPACGLDGRGTEHRLPNGQHVLDYICPLDHIWRTSWAELGSAGF